MGDLKNGARSQREESASLQTLQQWWNTKKIIHMSYLQCLIFDIVVTLLFFFPPQGSLLKSQRLSNRRSRKWGVAAQSLSLTCPTSFISAGEAWRASSMTRWPSASQRRSWSPGTCWPAATTTSTTSAPGSRRSGGWACSSAMGFYCRSGEIDRYCMNALWTVMDGYRLMGLFNHSDVMNWFWKAIAFWFLAYRIISKQMEPKWEIVEVLCGPIPKL